MSEENQSHATDMEGHGAIGSQTVDIGISPGMEDSGADTAGKVVEASPNGIFAIPLPRNACFSGREELLKELEIEVGQNPVVAITQPPAFHALGGLGKTELAVEYAYRHAGDYDAVLWASAESPDALRANIAALAQPHVLNLPERILRHQKDQASAVRNWLKQKERWLLILDGADSAEALGAIEKFLPSAITGNVLITSCRNEVPAGGTEVTVDAPDADEAVALLVHTVTAAKHDAGGEEDAADLVAKLGCLPLALGQAAACIVREKLSFAQYAGMLKANPGSKSGNVSQTIAIAQRYLSAKANAIFNVLSLSAAAPIPHGLFVEGEAILAGLEGTAEDALVELADHGLLTLLPESICCHGMVRGVASFKLSGAARQAATKQLLELINNYLPKDPPSHDVRSWQRWGPMRPHVELATQEGEKLGIAKPTVRLINELGLYLYARGEMAAAEPRLRLVLATFENSFGAEHHRVAKALNNLAQLLKATNRADEAEPLMRRALAIDEKAFGPEHPNVARDINNLAQLLHSSKRLSEAQPLMQRALAISQEHPEVARALTSMGLSLKAAKRPAEAEPLLRRALAIDEKVYGADHAEVARDLSNLGLLLHDTHRPADAEPFYRRAMEIDKKLHGMEHPDVARDLCNLAAAIQRDQRPKEAEPLLQRAVAIMEAIRRSTGQEHPRTAIVMRNYRDLLKEMELTEEQIGRKVQEALQM